jgi:hypothetical protein
MSEKASRSPRSDQLSLSIQWWQNFANDPYTLKLESTIDELSSATEHRLTGENKEEIQRNQIPLAERALSFYGVPSIKDVKSAENGYEFGFNYGGYLVDTVWYNHTSVSVKTWNNTVRRSEREAVWKCYEDELKNWNDFPETGKSDPRKQEDKLYDPMLRDLCIAYGFRRFTLRTTNHASHIQTRNVLPAALHLINMPIANSFPIVGPGQGDIDVIQPGKIISQRKRRDTVWVLNGQGSFVESTDQSGN